MMQEEKKHTKHTALIKPLGGAFHRNEWALLGAPCDRIDALIRSLNKILSGRYKLGYIDAAHNAAQQEGRLYSEYTDKINFQSFTTNYAPQQKQYRKFFNDLDILFVNGNHFKGSKQIVILNEKKKESLSRKLDRLTDVRLLITDGGECYGFLTDIVPHGTPQIDISAVEQIAAYIEKEHMSQVAPLFGLVLAGGKSQRMGSDKGALDYKGKPHREYTADLINTFCKKTYLSCRREQKESIETNYETLMDSFTGLGPYGAILSAFREHPNHAWLSIACDLPFMDEATIRELVEQRDPSKLASCFHNPETEFPEPLITIWEPRAYPVLLEFLSQGYSCPRKVLINTDIQEILISNKKAMLNANDKEAFLMAKNQLSN